MKNKGFTMVEVLAVIVIIAIIMVVAAPSIFKTGDRMNQKGLDSKIELIEKSAIIYAQDNANTLKKRFGSTKACDDDTNCYYKFYIAVDYLVKEGAYKSEINGKDTTLCDVENPVDKSCLDCATVLVKLYDEAGTAEAEFIHPTDENKKHTSCPSISTSNTVTYSN